MKIKVQPNEKYFGKYSSASKFTKFIRFFSNVYILPLEYKNDFKDVKFSLISLKTLIFLILISIPFLSLMIWLFVFQWGFTSQYIKMSLNVYHLFDFVQIFVLNMFIMNPLGTLPIILFCCHLWASFPALSQVWIESIFLAPTRRSRKANVRLFVCPFGSSLSRAIKLHYSDSDLHSLLLALSQQSLRSLLALS